MVTTSSGSLHRRLPPQPASVPAARRSVRELLLAGGRADLLDSAELLVSEIVTNALLHAGTPIELRASLAEDGLLVQVADGSPHLPARRHYAATSGTGRGLMLLGQLGDDWGVEQVEQGKRVWFRVTDGRRTADLDELASRATGTTQATTSTVSVLLGRMPLLLHAAWREHAEALLRELLLASLDEQDGTDPVQVHAEATDAIALLEEQVPEAGVVLPPDSLIQPSPDPVADLEIRIPTGSVAHFATLDRAIETALELSRTGRVMTPETQPEIRAFRRWLCRQVADQARGEPPQPFVIDRGLSPAVPLEVGGGLEAVSLAGTGRLAADEANRILAVSAPAARLLGYDDPEELVGHRLVEIVPERLRQAHVAGFTMYLLVGRQPLLDQAVVVPALRRDGTELDVTLLVTVGRDADGRRVFLAEIAAAEG